NPRLRDRLDAPGWPARPRTALAWLGESVAIKDPTAASFRGQQGDHLLVVGQDPRAALGLMSATLLSLAAHHHPSSARFYILDGTPEGAAPHVGLAEVADALPQTVFPRGRDDAAAVAVALAEEVRRRAEDGEPDDPDVFLLLHNLGRLRAFRRS